MSILISDEGLLELIQEIAEEKKQSPEQVVAAAIEAYATKRQNDNGFWESIIGLGNSGDPTLAGRDEEILAEDIDPIRGWGSDSGDTDTNRH